LLVLGFLKEGNPEKLKRRLAVIESRETFEGGGYVPTFVKHGGTNPGQMLGSAVLKRSRNNNSPTGTWMQQTEV